MNLKDRVIAFAIILTTSKIWLKVKEVRLMKILREIKTRLAMLNITQTELANMLNISPNWLYKLDKYQEKHTSKRASKTKYQINELLNKLEREQAKGGSQNGK